MAHKCSTSTSLWATNTSLKQKEAIEVILNLTDMCRKEVALRQDKVIEMSFHVPTTLRGFRGRRQCSAAIAITTAAKHVPRIGRRNSLARTLTQTQIKRWIQHEEGRKIQTSFHQELAPAVIVNGLVNNISDEKCQRQTA